MYFITHKNLFLGLAAAIVLGSIAVILGLGLHASIDFTGGSLTEVAYTTAPAKTDLSAQLDQQGLGDYSLRQTVEDSGKPGYILRSRTLTEAEHVQINSILTSAGQGGTITQFTTIGPVIGKELQQKAFWAIGLVSLTVIVYVAFAFSRVSYPVGSWVYGAITILVLIHDVLVPTATMALLGHFLGAQVDTLFVTALLAVLGYSVSDTIVVFDRIRENLKLNRTEKKVRINEPGGMAREEVRYTLTKPFGEIVGQSITDTLLRSINTSFTTLLALLAVYFIGAQVTQIFALVLIAGVIAGAYSSICIASPLLVFIAERQGIDGTTQQK